MGRDMFTGCSCCSFGSMGASVSVEAPDADELKRLFDKHDVTQTGKLERQEASRDEPGLGVDKWTIRNATIRKLH